jgi:hypothetical protein
MVRQDAGMIISISMMSSGKQEKLLHAGGKMYLLKRTSNE